MAAFSIFASAVPLIVRLAVAASFAVPVMLAKSPSTVTVSFSAGLMYSFAATVWVLSTGRPKTVPLTFVAPTIHIEPLSCTPVPVMLPPVMTVVPSFMSTEPIAALSLM